MQWEHADCSVEKNVLLNQKLVEKLALGQLCQEQNVLWQCSDQVSTACERNLHQCCSLTNFSGRLLNPIRAVQQGYTCLYMGPPLLKYNVGEICAGSTVSFAKKFMIALLWLVLKLSQSKTNVWFWRPSIFNREKYMEYYESKLVWSLIIIWGEN